MTSPDYSALRENAAIGAIAPRAQVAVAGPDRAAFLHGFLTNDIANLAAGRGCYAAWLTPQGRMLCDLHVLESGDMILLDLPDAEAAPAAARLEQFHFSEDVQIERLSSLRPVWIHGPASPRMVAAAVAGQASTFESWTQYQNARLEVGGAPVVVARIDQLAVPGFVVYAEVPHDNEVRSAFVSAGALEATPESIEAARLEAAYPVFGMDMTSETIPLEAGIEQRAISMTKGCYVGQEVIIRVLHRGHGRVARRLVRMQIDGTTPAPGAKVFSGEREVGFVTSAAVSPRMGPLALGYVHRDFVENGTALEIEAGTARLDAQVNQPSAS